MLQVVTQFKRMSVAEFERERALLRETYGESSIEAHAKRDQAMAKLFYRSGWTQEELAEKEGKSRQRIVQTLLFGRFLNFATTVANAENVPINLTERRFRSYWQQTDKSDTNERARFVAVMRLMQDDTMLLRKRRSQIGRRIVEKFGDGKWHSLAVIAKGVEASEEHAVDTLRGMMQATRGSYGAQCERKQVGTSFSYRIFRKEHTVSSNELAEKLGPIIESLLVEGKKNVNTMSPGTVARLAGLLQQQLDEWTR